MKLDKNFQQIATLKFKTSKTGQTSQTSQTSHRSKTIRSALQIGNKDVTDK